jgi:hypothetical protein
MEYVVYFELYGKKMRATVKAASHYDAMCLIKDKVIFHKIHTVEQIKEAKKNNIKGDNALDELMDIFGFDV